MSAILENLTVPILLTPYILGGRGRHNIKIEQLLSYLPSNFMIRLMMMVNTALITKEVTIGKKN